MNVDVLRKLRDSSRKVLELEVVSDWLIQEIWKTSGNWEFQIDPRADESSHHLRQTLYDVKIELSLVRNRRNILQTELEK